MDQFLLEAKALEFDDTDTATQVMKSTHPVQQKSLVKRQQTLIVTLGAKTYACYPS